MLRRANFEKQQPSAPPILEAYKGRSPGNGAQLGRQAAGKLPGPPKTEVPTNQYYVGILSIKKTGPSFALGVQEKLFSNGPPRNGNGVLRRAAGSNQNCVGQVFRLRLRQFREAAI